MSIETDIKQDTFKCEHQKAILNVIVTSGWLNSLHTAILKPYDISPQQYNVLRILCGQHPQPVTLGNVQERMLDKMSNASRLVDKLLEKDLVQRTQCCHNRRQVDILITAKGLEFLSKTAGPISMVIEQMQKISKEEAIELSRILEKMRG